MRLPLPAWTGLVALFPLMLDPSLAVARESIGIPLCTAAGAAGQVQVPVGPANLPGEDKDRCHAKGCHAGGSRKKQAVDHS
jgi:hypothetical protein